MLLFRSEEHAAAWSSQRGQATGAFLTLEQQWQLAQVWYSDRMSPEWRRRSAEEAESVFSSIGLRGEFWRLTAAPGE